MFSLSEQTKYVHLGDQNATESRILIESSTSPFNPLSLAHWGLLENHKKHQYSQYSPVE
jgi:hypothetical protein